MRFAAAEPLLLTEQLRKNAVHLPLRLAVVDEGGSLTHAELWAAIEAVAGALLDRGVAHGDRVATAMLPSLGHLVLILGCMAAGAVPVPLNIRLTAPELRAFLAPIEPALILADPIHRAQVADLGHPVLDFADADAAAPVRERLAPLWSGRPRTAALDESDVALIIGTGGTTGIPKGAVSTHRGLYLWCASCTLNGGRTRDDRELFFSPFFHISIVTGWVATLFAGGAAHILRRFSVEQSLDALERGATFLMGPPTMFQSLREHPDFYATSRAQVRCAGIGAMAASEDFLAGMLHDYPNVRLRHGYGATEFGPVTGIVHSDFAAGRLAGVGYALAGCRIRIEDEAHRALPTGEIGELVVACPWATVGYWGRPEETAATYGPTGIRLGDLGRIDPDGWIGVSGRKKEMIISGGENIFPNEVEAVLGRHPALAAISVYGVDDARWGERVEAAVVLKAGHALTREALVAFGRGSLGGYKLPKSMRILDHIPLTPANKPDRRQLRRASEAADRAAR